MVVAEMRERRSMNNAQIEARECGLWGVINVWRFCAVRFGFWMLMGRWCLGSKIDARKGRGWHALTEIDCEMNIVNHL